jgi:fructose-1,6-bisphosphatase/sedoheptulose 1,7-bisphosphatase-like protein
MCGTKTEKELKICAKSITNKTKCMSTNAKNGRNHCEDFYCEKIIVNARKEGLGNAHDMLYLPLAPSVE